jgi:hypothetical protein
LHLAAFEAGDPHRGDASLLSFRAPQKDGTVLTQVQTGFPTRIKRAIEPGSSLSHAGPHLEA